MRQTVSPKATQIYSLLLKHFGSQGWWPTTPKGKIQPVYHSKPKVKNFTESEKFEICIGAILTQNTAWSNVEKAFIGLHRHRLMSPQKIINTPSQKIQQLIRSSGYFRQKTKKLKFFCNYLIKNYSGKVSPLLKKPIKILREELLSLYGMGPETVDSILLYAGAKPIFVVDAYTRRIGNRVGLFKTDDYSEIQHFFKTELNPSPPVGENSPLSRGVDANTPLRYSRSTPLSKGNLQRGCVGQRELVSLYNDYHALLVALGKNYCRKNPLCEKCPLVKDCNFARANLPFSA